ncbi:hypothetical protein PC120_g20077 [Phytophthora cactorum]|nr:hypothetical protein PC120_g20077 [Phytophthora cactorum]
MIEEVEEWKASDSSLPSTTWSSERDGASEAGTCFMDAFRLALYYLGQPDLVTMEIWDAFEATRPNVIQFGVSRGDVSDFFKHLQRLSIRLNGVYIVSAGQDGVGHCFVVISHSTQERPIALDGYDAKRDPPMDVIPLSYQQWIEHVKWISRVEMQPGYVCRHSKRKSKTQRKREKRLKQHLQVDL